MISGEFPRPMTCLYIQTAAEGNICRKQNIALEYFFLLGGWEWLWDIQGLLKEKKVPDAY